MAQNQKQSTTIKFKPQQGGQSTSPLGLILHARSVRSYTQESARLVVTISTHVGKSETLLKLGLEKVTRKIFSQNQTQHLRAMDGVLQQHQHQSQQAPSPQPSHEPHQQQIKQQQNQRISHLTRNRRTKTREIQLVQVN